MPQKAITHQREFGDGKCLSARRAHAQMWLQQTSNPGELEASPTVPTASHLPDPRNRSLPACEPHLPPPEWYEEKSTHLGHRIVGVVRLRLCKHQKSFVEEMSKVFDQGESGGEAGRRLCQGPRSIADFSIEFCTLAVESG
ncbi:hypothetical protein SKAU_G00170490 [Synaphobranchus kaupii]|uniref:Uncharacterized protein n=1 Tax=Synaphobranchus kaupii TaxID=118154 RepID=A0A9Q1IYI8_SYNKA|nr:hypothetical protein SKAU_G00170490 [Synaphobranchus kaupii]